MSWCLKPREGEFGPGGSLGSHLHPDRPSRCSGSGELQAQQQPEDGPAPVGIGGRPALAWFQVGAAGRIPAKDSGSLPLPSPTPRRCRTCKHWTLAGRCRGRCLGGLWSAGWAARELGASLLLWNGPTAPGLGHSNRTRVTNCPRLPASQGVPRISSFKSKVT